MSLAPCVDFCEPLSSSTKYISTDSSTIVTILHMRIPSIAACELNEAENFHYAQQDMKAEEHFQLEHHSEIITVTPVRSLSLNITISLIFSIDITAGKLRLNHQGTGGPKLLLISPDHNMGISG